MRRRFVAVGLVLTALFLLPASASGVWGGSVDQPPNYPNVGAMYFDYDGTGPYVDGLVCSGSYAGPSKTGANDVFLLAGHCLPSPADGISASDLYVSFSNNASVSDTHVAVTSPIQVVSYHQMPGFGHDQGDFHDLGVLLLPPGSHGSLTPVQLAPPGFLDGLKDQGALKFRSVTLVGYGFTPIWEPAGKTDFAFDGKRKVGSSVVIGLAKAYVRLSQNNGVGTGSGQCVGDSGSPQIDTATGKVISVTSGGNGQCNSNNYNYRVDTAVARGFLDDFLNLQ
jgi:hypothetical protein